MQEKESYKSFLPQELYKQIEEIYDSFLEMQREAAEIATGHKVPDNAAHLNDVLKSTEEATNNILNAATDIQEAAEIHASPEGQELIIAQTIKIFEACNFQDLTGQRIKKILKNLGALEERIKKLALSAKLSNEQQKPKADEPSLLNGPQLTDEAPSQEDIDKLFSS